MPSTNNVALVFGTRPEAIKLCPLVLALQDHPTLRPHVCVTGQHRGMLRQVLEAFEIRPDVDLELMQPNQTLAELTARAVAALDGCFADVEPDIVLVQGDTTTTLCAALCAFYRRIPVGHVEAGLRTGDKYSPFPEEINRVLASRVADLHFAPTETARRNLLGEGVPEAAVHLTGNTGIDALRIALGRVRAAPPVVPDLPEMLQPGNTSAPDVPPRMVLITAHRRESFGPKLESICHAIATLSERFPEVHFVYPVHRNPNVRGPVHRILGARGDGHIHLIEPLDYLPFVALMDRAALLLTDSGGVQEEAPSLGKPVLVMRDTTERPEAVEMGTSRLVGTEAASIVDATSQLLTAPTAHAAMANAANPYGDGRACERIVAVLESQTNS